MEELKMWDLQESKDPMLGMISMIFGSMRIHDMEWDWPFV